MTGKIFVLLIINIFFFMKALPVLSYDIGAGGICKPNEDRCITQGYSCLQVPNDPQSYVCQKDPVKESFGSINPPLPLQQFIGKDPTGAGGISRFLSNLVALFYAMAGIVLIFMLLWGAWDWMTSEGDKEKLDSAKKKIINAIVGIVLFSIAFALIQILGQFTGFKFFVGQK